MSHPAFSRSKLAIETPEEDVKYVHINHKDARTIPLPGVSLYNEDQITLSKIYDL